MSAWSYTQERPAARDLVWSNLDVLATQSTIGVCWDDVSAADNRAAGDALRKYLSRGGGVAMKAIDLTEQKIGRHPQGTWVALSHNRVVAEGRIFEEAYDRAVKKGVKKPLIASTTAPPAPMIL